MSKIAIEILILLLLVLVNGLFAMAEIAVVSARKTRLQQQAEEGNKRAGVALELASAPNQFLATVQIGITLVGIMAGAFGGATIAEELAGALGQVPSLAPYSEAIGVGVVVLAITYFSLVAGELVPKRLGLNNAERVAASLAPLMRTLSRLSSPLVRLLSLSTDLALRLLGVRPEQETPVSEEEIKLLLDQGTRAGVFEPAEEEMVGHVFRLTDATVRALMTPRLDVVWLDLDDPAEEMRRIVASSDHACFPVARGSLDHVVGLVYAKDLLLQSLDGRPLDLEAAFRPALFLPETVTVLEAVEQMKGNRADAALIIDEYGGFEGLLTAADILQAIVGDIPTADQPAGSEAVQREDGSWLLSGMLPADEVKELLGIDSLPYEETHYQTLGGLVLLCLGRIPAVGDHFPCCGWQFEVVDMDDRRVDKVLAVPQAPDTAQA
ncbi:MAG: HlyC/CorC family transporter [Anaerolineae bacterium]|nr:HlyC/CorC family transporter [Anaerolineae bacterium]